MSVMDQPTKIASAARIQLPRHMLQEANAITTLLVYRTVSVGIMLSVMNALMTTVLTQLLTELRVAVLPAVVSLIVITAMLQTNVTPVAASGESPIPMVSANRMIATPHARLAMEVVAHNMTV